MIRKPDKYLVLIFALLILFHGRVRAFGPSEPTVTCFKDSLPPPATNQLFEIGKIFISGNRVTRGYIIEREMPFKSGDSLTLDQITQSFTRMRERLINTRLFNSVQVSLKEFRGYTIDIRIDVKERWYIFPLPYVRPVDRNFTAWADEHYSLKRFDYGLKYSHYNFTGRNDFLRIWLITGYTREVELAYDHPDAGKELKHGFGGGFLYAGLQELNVGTALNKQVFVNRDSLSNAGKFMREQMTFSLRYYYRPGLLTRHFLKLSFNNVRIDSAVLNYNPNYFLNNRRNTFYPEFSYLIRYNNIDYVPYPTRGFFMEGGLLKRGITADMNMWQLNVKTSEAFSIAPRMYFVSENLGLIRVPFKQPFYNEQLLGYNDFYMRGLERYVVDGVACVVARNSILRKLSQFSIPFLRGTSHDLIPFRIYAKAYVDLGYVYNKYDQVNSLVNKALYSGGVGVDVVTFYDFVFRAEFSMNQLGEKGIFFHIRNDF
ncbi:MAG: POTRA domain-containing protein [Bacteroidota bacterium]|nr:POTRA domain-containing protein [Bacteroidota bacterium]